MGVRFHHIESRREGLLLLLLLLLLKEEQKKRTNLPISIRIIDGNFFTCFDAFADEDDSLLAEPYEAFELAVGCAGVVYESCVVAGFPLPDLVDCAVGLAYHDILVFHSWGSFLMLVRVSFFWDLFFFSFLFFLGESSVL